jgi:putative PEP-CTERM system histidine kinase
MSTSIATIGYAIAAIVYAFLSALLVSSWRGRLPGVLLLIACVITAAWAAAMTFEAGWTGRASVLGDCFEILHKGVWLTFLLVLLGYARAAAGGVSPAFKRFALAIVATWLMLLGATAVTRVVFETAYPWARAASEGLGILGPGLLAIVGMLLTEHVFRNTEPARRWSLKYLCLALGAVFAFDFYLYSDALLFRRVSPDIWGARGIVSTLVAPLIAVSAARNPSWSLDVFVSRQAVFHSTTLIAASAYLLVMAVAGYYIRFFGGSWGSILQITFLFGAGILLSLMLFSGTLRAWVRVFLSKHFFSYRYDYREEWLRFTRILSEGEPGVRLHERSIEALATLVESPAGGLWIRTEASVFEPIAFWNMIPVHKTEPTVGALGAFLQEHQWVVSLDELRASPDTYFNLELPQWLRQDAHAWLIVPLMLHDSLLGFVVLARSRVRFAMNWEVNDLLKTAGRQSATYLAQVQAADALARSKQFDSFNRMSAFVVHDLKNLVAQLSLLLSNAQKHKDNPEFQADMLETVENSVAKMNRILMQLRSGGLPVERPKPILIDDVISRAIASKGAYRPVPLLDIASSGLSVVANAERLERVLGHLIQNAIEATPITGKVQVRVVQAGQDAVIEVVDDGAGMTEQFIRTGLFKPFETTKASGMGIGVYESREYVRELGGDIAVTSEVGRGTRFRLSLPLAHADREGAVLPSNQEVA